MGDKDPCSLAIALGIAVRLEAGHGNKQTVIFVADVSQRITNGSKHLITVLTLRVKNRGRCPEVPTDIKVGVGAWQVKDYRKHENTLLRPPLWPHQAPHLRDGIPPFAQALVLLDHVDHCPGLSILASNDSPKGGFAALNCRGTGNEKLKAIRRRPLEGR
jgi:hypothetical protein